MLVDKVRVADLAVEQANGLANFVGDAALDQEVLVPIPLGKLLAQGTHEELDDPSFGSVVLVVDVDHLSKVLVLGEHSVEVGIGRFGGPGLHLGLGPLTAEDGDDRGAAGQHRCGVLGSGSLLLYGLAEQIREEERKFGLEEARRGDERFSFVELEIAPITKVRSRDLCCPVRMLLLVTSNIKKKLNIICLQLLPPHQVLIVIYKVISTLPQRTRINARIFARSGRLRHANGSRERLGCELALDPLSEASWGLNWGALGLALGVHGCARAGLRMADGGDGEAPSVLAVEAEERTLLL